MNYLNEIKEIVAGILQIPVESLDVNADMNDVENWDSMRNIMIFSKLEEHYDILFPAVPVGYGLSAKYMFKVGWKITLFTLALMTVSVWVLMKFWPVFTR